MPRRHWIPPGALAFGMASHGASWILLAFVAANQAFASFTPLAGAWIHLVVLGWFSMTAFGILIHAIPAFTDLQWTNEHLARRALVAFGAAVVLFVIAWLAVPALLLPAALLTAVAFAAYLAPATATLSKGRNAPRVERAVSRALATTLWMFAVVATLGVVLALSYAGATSSSWLQRVPEAHAALGLYGWLTVLVFGVSARTLRPICGVRSRLRLAHVLNGACTLLGSIVLALGVGTGALPVAVVGAALVVVGVLCYVADTADIVARATVAHRPPQAFVAAALLWLCVSLVAGGGVLFRGWSAAPYVFLTLVGWVGQMVNAHILHIGVRLIATMQRGEDDETPPSELLRAPLSWAAFAAFQAAIVACLTGLWTGSSGVVIGGAAVGLAGWLLMVVNLALARRRAATAPALTP